MNEHRPLFDQETEDSLPALFANLPEPVRLVVWGDAEGSIFEAEAIRLCQDLSERFAPLSYTVRPRRENYPYYPVIGVMGDLGSEDEWEDFGVRIIGLPIGYQMTTFVTAVQAVSFRGMTLDAKTRIQLKRLTQQVMIQVISAADNEGGALVAQPAFNMAAANENIRVFFIMADQFPEITDKYSIDIVPHMVINGRVHISGLISEDNLLKQVAQAVKTAPIA
jgi:alkyl hydroperoxide reductase subunit F